MTKSSFSKQISIKVNVNYCKKHKILIFYGYLLRISTLKLRKILQICVRSFVNSHPVEYDQYNGRSAKSFVLKHWYDFYFIYKRTRIFQKGNKYGNQIRLDFLSWLITKVNTSAWIKTRCFIILINDKLCQEF